MNDTRIVYGATCVWWDSIDKVATTGKGIPCCPHCRGVLFEMDSEKEWWNGVDSYEMSNELGYRKFVEWQRGKCFKTVNEAKAAYEKEKVR